MQAIEIEPAIPPATTKAAIEATPGLLTAVTQKWNRFPAWGCDIDNWFDGLHAGLVFSGNFELAEEISFLALVGICKL